MKKCLRFLVMTAAVASIVLSVSSCSKEGVKRFSGNYSFKTSGTITAMAVSAEGTDDGTATAEGDGTVTVNLTAESGQMTIVTSDKSDGEMIVAMNILGGDVITFNAKADDKTLTIEPFTRTLTLHVGTIFTDLVSVETTVTVSGEAQRYDSSLLFNLTYEGSYTHLGTEYRIISSDVQCWAKSND